jgi:hypothetical protein
MHRKGETNGGVNPVGASEAGSFVTGPQGCGRYARGLEHERIPPLNAAGPAQRASPTLLPGGLHEFVLVLPQYEDRTVRMANHSLGGAAHQNVREAGSSVSR